MTPQQEMMKDIALGVPVAILKSPFMLVVALMIGALIGWMAKAQYSQWE